MIDQIQMNMLPRETLESIKRKKDDPYFLSLN